MVDRLDPSFQKSAIFLRRRRKLLLEEGVNKIILEVYHSKLIPQQPKSYSSTLYIKKE